MLSADAFAVNIKLGIFY